MPEVPRISDEGEMRAHGSALGAIDIVCKECDR